MMAVSAGIGGTALAAGAGGLVAWAEESGRRRAGDWREEGCGSRSTADPGQDPVQASRRRRSRPRGQQRGRGPFRQHAPRVLRR